jgi:hypothetical protein
VYVILVKENIVQLPHIDHFAALLALVEVPSLRFTQLIKLRGIQRRNRTSHRFESQGRLIAAEETLTAFLEPERVTRESLRFQNAD